MPPLDGRTATAATAATAAAVESAATAWSAAHRAAAAGAAAHRSAAAATSLAAAAGSAARGHAVAVNADLAGTGRDRSGRCRCRRGLFGTDDTVAVEIAAAFDDLLLGRLSYGSATRSIATSVRNVTNGVPVE